MRIPLLAIAVCVLSGVQPATPAGRSDEKPQPVPEAEYRVYDLVIEKKFLTSQTNLVVIERLTVIRLGPDEQDRPNRAFFDAHQFFEGRLRPDLVTEFIIKNVRPSKLQGRFRFGVRYQFLSDGVLEEPEVSRALPALLTQASPTVGAIGFSRVGFSQRGDEALVYVSDNRQDGTGAGFLFLLQQKGRSWEFVDSEILWSAQPDRER